ncbi:MAG: hypothetical protein ACXVAN_19355, partial [Polyangia bacterium]
ALGGELAEGRVETRLVISLGPPCPAAGAGVERRVRLGGRGGDDADYVGAGDPATLAAAFARAVTDGAVATVSKAGSKSEGKK